MFDEPNQGQATSEHLLQESGSPFIKDIRSRNDGQGAICPKSTGVGDRDNCVSR